MTPATPPRSAPATPPPGGRASRAEKTFVYMAAGVIGISVVGILVVVIAILSGGYSVAEPLWAFLTVLPFIGLIAGFILVIAYVIASVVRRRREGSA